MGNNEERKVEKRKPSLGLSILMLAIAAALILSGVVIYGQDVHIMLIFSAIIVGAVGILYLHYSYEELEKGIIEGIMTTMQACLILYTVGVLIGTWIHSGVVPTMIYYGLSILSPSIFLFATLVICSIVSLATGTSWGTSGTVGIALLGIAMGLGIPAPLTVGVIVSGAYAGDKMSPLSDTTNLAPAVSGTDLFQHIRAMCWTTGPTYVIVAVITIVLGFQYAGGTLDYTKIGGIQAVIAKEFWVSPIALLAPVVVIVLSALRKPALPSLWAGVFIAAAFMFIEGYDYGAVLNVMQNGYSPTVSAELAGAADEAALAAVIAKHALEIDTAIAQEIGNDIVELVSAGGMQSMNWTVSLIICAFVFGSAMNVCGFIKTILEAVASRVRTVGGLILSVVVSCLVCNFFLGDQYLGIAMPGTMYKETFDKLGLHPRMLSRSLEDSGTLTSVLVPWNTCGAYHAELFNMSVAEFGPYAFLNWMNPVIAIIMTYLGIGIFWRGKDGEPVRGGKTRPAELA